MEERDDELIFLFCQLQFLFKPKVLRTGGISERRCRIQRNESEITAVKSVVEVISGFELVPHLAQIAACASDIMISARGVVRDMSIPDGFGDLIEPPPL